MRKWSSDLSAVARRAKAERGMSLVEATIILMALSLITAIVAPSVGDYIDDTRHTKAKEDVEVLGTAILRVVRDSSVPCLVTDTPGTGCKKGKRVDLLYGSSGNYSGVSGSANTTYVAPSNATTDGNYNWKGSTDGDLLTQTDTFEHQLVSNTPVYTTVGANFTPSMNTASGVGWRGPYIASPFGADPWGSGYQANTVFLSVANDANSGTTEGLRDGGWHRDVFVVSAGPNAKIETVFASNTSAAIGSAAEGDDIIYLVQGTTK